MLGRINSSLLHQKFYEELEVFPLAVLSYPSMFRDIKF